MCDLSFDVALWLFYQILLCLKIIYVGISWVSHLFILGDGRMIEKGSHTSWAVNVS